MSFALLAMFAGIGYARYLQSSMGLGRPTPHWAEYRREWKSLLLQILINTRDSSFLVTRLTSDVTIIQNFAMGTRLRVWTNYAGHGLWRFIMSPERILLCCLSWPLRSSFIVKLLVLCTALCKAQMMVPEALQEDLPVRVIKAYVREGYVSERLKKLIPSMRRRYKDLWNVSVLNALFSRLRNVCH